MTRLLCNERCCQPACMSSKSFSFGENSRAASRREARQARAHPSCEDRRCVNDHCFWRAKPQQQSSLVPALRSFGSRNWLSNATPRVPAVIYGSPPRGLTGSASPIRERKETQQGRYIAARDAVSRGHDPRRFDRTEKMVNKWLISGRHPLPHALCGMSGRLIIISPRFKLMAERDCM